MLRLWPRIVRWSRSSWSWTTRAGGDGDGDDGGSGGWPRGLASGGEGARCRRGTPGADLRFRCPTVLQRDRH